eukprot:1159407-Pelagomonas_calceolata.AAC.5
MSAHGSAHARLQMHVDIGSHKPFHSRRYIRAQCRAGTPRAPGLWPLILTSAHCLYQPLPAGASDLYGSVGWKGHMCMHVLVAVGFL